MNQIPFLKTRFFFIESCLEHTGIFSEGMVSFLEEDERVLVFYFIMCACSTSTCIPFPLGCSFVLEQEPRSPISLTLLLHRSLCLHTCAFLTKLICMVPVSWLVYPYSVSSFLRPFSYINDAFPPWRSWIPNNSTFSSLPCTFILFFTHQSYKPQMIVS